MARKTLVIGLGGTGCSVVEQVKTFVGDNTQSIQFVGMDTDSNRAGSYHLDVIRTGRNILAERLMDKKPEMNEWFPYDPNLLGRTMQNGAGQVRALSRLALKDVIRQRGMGRLINALETLHTAGNDNDTVDFYISIVSSFAGGTGSGMFISLALWLRKYILDTYGTNVIIDGVFALPDVFMSNGNSAVQKESMYANTFAALRELANVSRVCLSDNPRANDIIMEYRVGKDIIFDSQTERPDEEHLPVKKKPFDVMFFFDKVNSRSNVLPGGMNEYIRCMAQAVFMRCFAPGVKEGVRSREDNEVISQIEKKNENRYGSLGTARLIYPYEDILKYCNLSSARDAMGKRWSASEEDYKQHHAVEEELNRMDPSFKPRSRGEIFIDWMNENLNSSEYSFLKDALLEETKDGGDDDSRSRRRGRSERSGVKLVPKAGVYMQNVIRFLTERAESLITLPEKARISVIKAFNAKTVEDTVDDVEGGIKSQYQEIKNTFRSKVDMAVERIIPKEYSKITDKKRGNENIGNLLQKEWKAVHPLATRYLLYSFNDLLKDELLSQKKARIEAETEIDEYIHKDWIGKTAEIESAMDAIPNAMNVIAMQEYVRRYVNDSGRAIDCLGDYRNSYLAELVLEGIHGRLEQLIHQYELLFDMLPDIQKKLNKDIDELETGHASDSMEQYVCASPQMKKQLYASLSRPSDTGRDNPMYGSILKGLYVNGTKEIEYQQKVATHQIMEDDIAVSDEDYKVNIQNLFDESILPAYAEELSKQEGNKEKLDKDILTALDEEARERARKLHKGPRAQIVLSDGEIMQQKQSIIRDLVARSAPHLMYRLDNIDDATHIMFWGINDTVAKGKNLNALLKYSEDDPSIADDPHYSTHELSVYSSVIGLMLSDIRSFIDFGEETGIYYKMYQERLTKVAKGFYKNATTDEEREGSVTPHADARWHRRDYLMPLSKERDNEDQHKAARAMWLGILYGNIDVRRYQRINMIQVSFEDPLSKDMAGGNLMEPLYSKGNPVKNFNDMYNLYHGVANSDMMPDRLLEVLEPAYRADANSFKAVGSSKYNMRGKHANRLLQALHDDEHAQDPQNGKNVLTLLEDILKQEAYNDTDTARLNAEKELIANELFAIIDGLNMDPKRKKELCAYIAQNSIYRTNLVARNRDAQYLTAFDIENLPAKKPAPRSRTKEQSAAIKPDTDTVTKANEKVQPATVKKTTKISATAKTQAAATKTKSTAKSSAAKKPAAGKATAAKKTAGTAKTKTAKTTKTTKKPAASAKKKNP